MTQGLLLMFDSSQYSPFCPICWAPPPKTEAFPKTCSRCGAPTLAANFKKKTIELGPAELGEMLPFGTEWLLLERVAVDADLMSPVHAEPYKATGTFTVTKDHCSGHFKTKPVFPGALMMEAANQVFAALVLVMRKHLEMPVIDPAANEGMIVKIDKARFNNVVIPDSVVTMSVTITGIRPWEAADAKFIIFEACGTSGESEVYFAKHTCYIFHEQEIDEKPFTGVEILAPEPVGVPMSSGGVNEG